MRRLLLTALAVVTTAGTAAVRADNWPQWRGLKNDGISQEKDLPAKFGDSENVVWKVKMPGPGASTPCIWDKSIFVTAVDGSNLTLSCISTDGKELWKEIVGSGNKTARGDEGNSASASCSTDGKLVYVFVGDGTFAAYDFKGKRVWKHDCQKEYGQFSIQFGAHWTPVLYKDHLYVALLHRKAQVIVAFDAATGKELWKADRKSDGRGESPDVYSSPFIWEKGSEALLIVHGNDYCTAHKLSDGSEVWRVTELNPKSKYNMAWRSVSSPVATPDLIIVPSCKNGVTVAIDPSKAKGSIEPKNSAEIWRLTSGTPDVPSPLVVDGIVYIFRETQNIAAYDAKTGAQLYSEKVNNHRNRANPVYADGKIYLSSREGDFAVIKAGKEFEVLAKNKLKDTFTASPAISNGRIYLRGWDYLWAIGTK